MQAVHLSGGAPHPSGWPPPCSAPDAPLPSASQGSSASSGLPRSPPHSSQVSSCGGSGPPGAGRRTVWSPFSGGEYYRFERNGVDVSGLIPGDPVTVTYTGALDPEEGTVSAVLLSITRDTLLSPDGRIHRWDAAVLYRPLLTSEGRASG